MNALRTVATAAFLIIGSSAAMANACQETYTAKVEPVVSKKCVACHNDNTATSGVSFQKGSGYENLVNVASVELPTMPRVTPGDRSQSYVAHKLLDTHTDVGGTGAKMPPSGALRKPELEAILNWIDGCAAE
jgi:hypothetical protein